MPIYDYRCRGCGKKSSFFVRTVNTPLEPACEHCGAREMERTISPFAYHRSMQTRWDSAGDPTNPGADYYDDPSNVGRWVEERWGGTMGDEAPPGEVQGR